MDSCVEELSEWELLRYRDINDSAILNLLLCEAITIDDASLFKRAIEDDMPPLELYDLGNILRRALDEYLRTRDASLAKRMIAKYESKERRKDLVVKYRSVPGGKRTRRATTREPKKSEQPTEE